MQFPHALFKQAGLNPTDVANLFGVSRITGWRWMSAVDRSNNHTEQGAGVNIFLRDRVAQVAAQVQGAVDAGTLPDEAIRMLDPDRRAAKLKSILKQYRTK